MLKANGTKCAKQRRIVSAIVCIGISCASYGADVAVREYDKSAFVLAGEMKNRDISGLPHAPYVATSPFAISFTPKFEAPDESWDAAVFRLNILVGSHRAVYALDIGGLGNFADYKMDGIGVAGLFNSVGGSDCAILVAGLFNFATVDFAGLQVSGFYSCTERIHCGLQVGTVNYAGKLVGVQLGIANYADRLEGVQIGLANCSNAAPISFMPVMNVGF